MGGWYDYQDSSHIRTYDNQKVDKEERTYTCGKCKKVVKETLMRVRTEFICPYCAEEIWRRNKANP